MRLSELQGKSPAARATLLLRWLESGQSSAYIGEPIDQLAHALQAAAEAQVQTEDEEVILAALFHDLGHLVTEAPQMEGLGTVNHEHIASAILTRAGASRRLCRLIAGHVDAKRYLCAKDPLYYQALSKASRGTLAYQGGPMTPKELQDFECSDDAQGILLLRRCDELAKVPGKQVPSLESYHDLLTHHLSREATDVSEDFTC